MIWKDLGGEGGRTEESSGSSRKKEQKSLSTLFFTVKKCA
jgi:hypothetical protein